MADFPAPDVLAKSKQKNCNGCVQAKRRCDRRTPTCSRCIEKRIPCTWGKRKLTTGHPSIRRRLECAPTEEALSFGGDYTPSSFVSSLDYLDSLHTPSHISAGAEISATPGDHMQSYVLDAELDPDLPMDSFLDLMNDTTPVSGQSLIQSEKRPLANRPGTPAGEEVIQSYMKMTGLCVGPLFYKVLVAVPDDTNSKCRLKSSPGHCTIPNPYSVVLLELSKVLSPTQGPGMPHHFSTVTCIKSTHQRRSLIASQRAFCTPTEQKKTRSW